MKYARLLPTLLLSLTACGHQPQQVDAPVPSPNVVILYADDLGYGDVGSYGATGVDTPSIDALATHGIRFTNAHATASVCTPSRYSLLTGEYAFRVQAHILRADAPAMIRPGKPTLASLFREAGYATGVVGKWHLGLGAGDIDWNDRIAPGPAEIGFDYSFLIPATNDRVPSVFVENQRVVGADPNDPIEIAYGRQIGDRPGAWERPEDIRVRGDFQHGDVIINGVPRIGFMSGGKEAEWVDEEFADTLTEKALGFIRDHRDGPFFLFYSFNDIHAPRLPHPRFVGKSTMGVRGDGIAQLDWMVGEVTAELERLGLAENTVIVFSSDNGPVLFDGYFDDSEILVGEHEPAGPFRGGKYSILEGGTRVPLIIRWPAGQDPGESDALVSQVDFYASFATLLGHELARNEAIDSRDLLDTLLGRATAGRRELLTRSTSTVAVRDGNLKYIAPVSPRDGREPPAEHKDIATGLSTAPQLYDLASDPGERSNLAADRPDRVAALKQRLEQIRARKERVAEVPVPAR